MRKLMTRALKKAVRVGAALLVAPMLLVQAAWAGDLVGAQETGIGNPAATVTVVEYASVTCPHCARFNANVLPLLKQRYIDTGKVRYVFKEFPTPPEQISAAGFMVARCSGPARYLTVVDALFRAQEALYQTKNINAFLMSGAKAGGLGEEQMRQCIADGPALEAFNARVERAASVDKINGTPTVLVNGKLVDPKGAEMTIADLETAIRPLLGQPAKPRRVVRRPPTLGRPPH